MSIYITGVVGGNRSSVSFIERILLATLTCSGPNKYIFSYPSRGIALHYHFAKLQLNALSIRGFQHLVPRQFSAARKSHASIAISSAIAILRQVIDEPDIRASIVGVPLYLHTMIAYAAVFLLKVQLKWSSLQINTESVDIYDLVGQVVVLLREAKANERHLSYHIAAGLEKMLQRSRTAGNVSDQRPLPPVTDVNTANVIGSSEFTTMDAAQDHFNADYGPFIVPTEQIDLFDERLFPIGFFDTSVMMGDGQFKG